MQDLNNTNLNLSFTFQERADLEGHNENQLAFMRKNCRRAIIDAYSMGAVYNNWKSSVITFDDDYVSLTTFKHNYEPHRIITI